MGVLHNGHCLTWSCVPDTDVRILANLPSSYQLSLWVQCYTVNKKKLLISGHIQKQTPSVTFKSKHHRHLSKQKSFFANLILPPLMEDLWEKWNWQGSNVLPMDRAKWKFLFHFASYTPVTSLSVCMASWSCLNHNGGETSKWNTILPEQNFSSHAWNNSRTLLNQ